MKNWKTTLAGIFGTIGVGMSQSTDPIIHAIGLVVAVISPVILGAVAKDSNVTGGTVVQ
jgi:hypothetical protein